MYEELSILVENAASVVRPPVLQRQAGNGYRPDLHIHDAKIRRVGRKAALDHEGVGTRPQDRQVLVDQQLAAGQGDDAVDGEADDLAPGGIGNRFSQGTRPIVGRGVDCGGLGGRVSRI